MEILTTKLEKKIVWGKCAQEQALYMKINQ